MTDADMTFMKRAIELAREGVERNEGGPFGCVIVRDGTPTVAIYEALGLHTVEVAS